MKDVVGGQLFFENGFDIVVARDVVFSSDCLAKIKDHFACISDGGFERTVTVCSNGGNGIQEVAVARTKVAEDQLALKEGRC